MPPFTLPAQHHIKTLSVNESQKRAYRTTGPIFYAGALAGVILAAAGLLSTPQSDGALGPGIVARVNSRALLSDDFQRLVSGLRRDQKRAFREEDKERIVERMVDEELLVQRGLELGLADSDKKIRKDLAAAVIESVIAVQKDLQPSENELQKYYAANRGLFKQADRLRVRQIWIRSKHLKDAEKAYQKAQGVLSRLDKGDSFGTLQTEVGDTPVAPLPDTALPPAKLMDYLGASALRALQKLDVGEVSKAIRSSSGYHILQVVERHADEIAGFESSRPLVLASMRRDAADQALGKYLRFLRDRAELTILDQLP